MNNLGAAKHHRLSAHFPKSAEAVEMLSEECQSNTAVAADVNSCSSDDDEVETISEAEHQEPEKKKRKTLVEQAAELFTAKEVGQQQLEYEISTYMNLPLIDKNPLLFWKENQKRFPSLAK